MNNKLSRFRILVLGVIVFNLSLLSCKNKETENKDNSSAAIDSTESNEPFFKLSLAQWSLEKPIHEGELDPVDFAEKAKELGFNGIEYVNQLYFDKYRNSNDPEAAFSQLLDTLKAKSEQFNVKNVLIMVDGEGDLARCRDAESVAECHCTHVVSFAKARHERTGCIIEAFRFNRVNFRIGKPLLEGNRAAGNKAPTTAWHQDYIDLQTELVRLVSDF